jgi:hypothetical protein
MPTATPTSSRLLRPRRMSCQGCRAVKQ